MMTTEEKILQLVREANPDNPQEYVDSILFHRVLHNKES